MSDECCLPPICGLCLDDGFPHCDVFGYCVYKKLFGEMEGSGKCEKKDST